MRCARSREGTTGTRARGFRRTRASSWRSTWGGSALTPPERVTFSFEQHTAIFGKTSSGKTYFAKRLFQACPVRAVYWNRQRERGLGPEVRQWDVRMLAQPQSRVNLIPPRETKESQALLSKIVEDLFRVGERVAKDRRPLVVFFHDEPDKEAPAWDKESGAYEIAVRGNRHGVKLVAITQAPSQFSMSARKSCPNKILFAVDEEEEGWLRRHHVPDDVFRWVAWSIDPKTGEARPSYRFGVNQGAGWVPCEPVS